MPIFANADEGRISAVEEATWGVTPENPALTRARVTSFGLAGTLAKAVSAELNANAAVADLFPTSGGAEGDINLELTFGPLEHKLWEHALRGVFDAYGILKAGVLAKSMTWEQDYLVDTTHFFKYFPGCRINSFAVNLDAAADAAVNATLSLMGKGETPAASAVTGGTYAAANTSQPMFMPEVRALTVTGDGISGAMCFSNFSFTINNNCRVQQGKCTDTTVYPDLSSKGIGYGRREITIELAAYFIGLTLTTIFQENTSFSLSYIISNGTQGYKITFPRVKLLENAAPLEGNSSDVMENISAQALYSATDLTDMIVERIDDLTASAAVKAIQKGATTVTPAGVLATYYKNGATQNSKPVYQNIAGTYALWFDGTNTIATSLAHVGNVSPTILFTIAGNTVTGDYAAGAGGAGEITVSAYNPAA